MKRRGFLKLLGLLPFAPALAEAAAATIKPKFINPLPEALALTGSDQTSMWLVHWGETLGPPPTLLDFAKRHKHNDLPVIEALQQRNPLLQDTVWKDKWHDLSEYILPAPERV